MKSKVRMFLAAASALIVLFGMTGCPQSQSGGETIMIDITVKGDANVNVPADPVQVTLGSQWSTVKAILTPKVTAKTGWLIDSWHPGEDASQPEIDNAKIFYGDETVFVKSRPILPPLPKPAKPGDPSVKITFEVASEAGKILGDNPVIVRPNTTWADLKDYAKAALKTNYGFSEESVQWKQGSAPLSDGTSFTANATITAYPEDLRIFITVAGDSYVNVTDAEEKIIAINGTKWKTIKETAAAKVTVSDSNRAVTEWKLNNAGGITLTDGFEFKKADGQNRTVFAVTGDRRITLTVKYGTGSGSPTTGGTITIYDGDTWGNVKAQAAEKVIVPQDHIIRVWRLNDTGGPVLSGSYTFKVSDGNARTVYAELQNQKIKVTVKYGELEGVVKMLPEPIIVLNGKRWSEVADEFEAKVNAKLPQDFEIDRWRWDDDNGSVIAPEHTFKTENAPYTVYARLKDKRIKVTIKYGKLKGSAKMLSVPMIVLEGKTWGEVKAAAKAKIPASDSVLYNAAVSEWRWDNADGDVIDDRETFYVDGGQTRTVYALIRSKITISKKSNTDEDRKLTYYAPIGGTVTKCEYELKGLAAASGTVGDNSQTDNREHTVTLSAYKIGEIEIPQALYELVMGENPSKFQGSEHLPTSGETQELRPVEYLTWREAVLFCNELTLCTGMGKDECVYVLDNHPYTMKDVKEGRDPGIPINQQGFRLPTEAEWEWAAQGGSARHKWAGTNSSGQLGTYAWYRDNSDNKTREVKKKSPNGFDLYDMSGNVWEWCWDWYSADTPPGNMCDPIGVLSGTNRVIRGGGYGEHWSDCGCAVRQSMNQAHPKVGFRIVSRY